MIDIPSSRSDIEILSVPATELATQAGSLKVQNMVILGAYLERTKLIDMKTVMMALQSMLKKASLLELNQKAIDAGRNYVRSNT